MRGRAPEFWAPCRQPGVTQGSCPLHSGSALPPHPARRQSLRGAAAGAGRTLHFRRNQRAPTRKPDWGAPTATSGATPGSQCLRAGAVRCCPQSVAFFAGPSAVSARSAWPSPGPTGAHGLLQAQRPYAGQRIALAPWQLRLCAHGLRSYPRGQRWRIMHLIAPELMCATQAAGARGHANASSRSPEQRGSSCQAPLV